MRGLTHRPSAIPLLLQGTACGEGGERSEVAEAEAADEGSDEGGEESALSVLPLHGCLVQRLQL